MTKPILDISMDIRCSSKVRPTLLRLGIAIFCACALFVMVSVIFRYAVNSARETQWRSTQEHIGRSINHYRSHNGVLPPASVLDDNRRPMHSWRVLILPYIEQNLFSSCYHFDEPWNGPNNQLLLQSYTEGGFGDKDTPDVTVVRSAYQHPEHSSYENDFHTNLVMVINPNLPLVQTIGNDDVVRGKKGWHYRLHAGSDPMVVGITGPDFHWMEPRDMSPEELLSLGGDDNIQTKSLAHIISSFIVNNDGTVRILSSEETVTQLRTMLQDSSEANPQ